MPTAKRELVPGEIYHIYNRSAGKKRIFHSKKDYNRFILKMCEYKEKFPVDMLAYCLMPNHFHFLIRVVEDDRPTGSTLRVGSTLVGSAQTFFHRLLTSYSKYYDCKYEHHSGRVFQSNYKAKHVGDDAYYLQLCGYIHDNPVRKKLVSKPEEWPWSSYPALTNIRDDGISCAAPELRQRGMNHRKIYRDFARNRADALEEIMGYI